MTRPPVSLLSAWTRTGLVALCLAGGLWARAAQADELSEVQRLYYAGQQSAAMQKADEFLTAHPLDAQMRFMKAVMLADAKRDADAIALLQAINGDFPDLAEPYNNLAALYAGAGDYARARATLEQALRINPSYATAHENLGDVQAALAAQSYARAQALDPANVTAPPKLAIVRQLYKRSASAAGSASAATSSR